MPQSYRSSSLLYQGARMQYVGVKPVGGPTFDPAIATIGWTWDCHLRLLLLPNFGGALRSADVRFGSPLRAAMPRAHLPDTPRDHSVHVFHPIRPVIRTVGRHERPPLLQEATSVALYTVICAPEANDLLFSVCMQHRKSGLRYGSDAVHKESSNCGRTYITRAFSRKPLALYHRNHITAVIRDLYSIFRPRGYQALRDFSRHLPDT
ncbi:hypothetical protein C8Q74DRAFT_1214139 [Fomes fomentarius]|nr:hypothetical protein C8Q74DRAFT_1214139 [Fomes fomentarius]